MINNNSDDFIKTDDGAVINTNIDDFKRYKMEREKSFRQIEVDKRLSKIEKDIIQIKKILTDFHAKIG